MGSPCLTKKSLLGSTNVTGAGNGDAVQLRNTMEGFIFFVECDDFTSGQVDAKIQHSPDKVNWFDIVAFTAITGVTKEIKFPPSSVPSLCGYIRAKYDVTGATDADIYVDMYCGEKK